MCRENETNDNGTTLTWRVLPSFASRRSTCSPNSSATAVNFDLELGSSLPNRDSGRRSMDRVIDC